MWDGAFEKKDNYCETARSNMIEGIGADETLQNDPVTTHETDHSSLRPNHSFSHPSCTFAYIYETQNILLLRQQWCRKETKYTIVILRLSGFICHPFWQFWLLFPENSESWKSHDPQPRENLDFGQFWHQGSNISREVVTLPRRWQYQKIPWSVENIAVKLLLCYRLSNILKYS